VCRDAWVLVESEIVFVSLVVAVSADVSTVANRLAGNVLGLGEVGD